MYKTDDPAVKYRKDYCPSQFLIKSTNLQFELFDEYVLVTSQLEFYKNPLAASSPIEPLTLNGIELELVNIKINSKVLTADQYQTTDNTLSFLPPSDQFNFESQVKIYPNQNTSLEGLYTSNGKFCTQCEAEGFRKITYYLDRPDVMSEFHVSIEGDQKKYPLLLSNGNPIKSSQLDAGRHRVEWHDPFPKPCYLFALVAGDLDCLEDEYITTSGRNIKLQLFVDKGKLDQCDFAMQSLKHSMKWDEDNFGLEYDLDLYMIVAVGDFNMGAMENKGLNIFNTAYVLANKKSATDSDFEGVERVIAHEYFHNWTGNRVTCRDWFQLSLKEGLTVFRDQKFSEDRQSAAVERIDQVKIIRAAQFAEDSGPMAHPIRPDSYIEMNNFYTVTVYNKGAEVIRMMHTLLGKQGFREGMDLYFQRHDGQAVTCEDFVKAMEDANQVDWTQFRRWYSQAGTPEVKISLTKETEKKFILQLSQSCPPTPGQNNKEPFLIPIKIGFLNSFGKIIDFEVAPSTHSNAVRREQVESRNEALILLTNINQTFEIILDQPAENINPSLLRSFSAPVKINYDYSNQALAQLFAKDDDTFNRWDAGQQLMTKLLLSDENNLSQSDLSLLTTSLRNVLEDDNSDNSLKALAVQLPTLNSLIGQASQLDLDKLFGKFFAVKRHIARILQSNWEKVIAQVNSRPKNQQNSGDRWLKNVALANLAEVDIKQYAQLIYEQQTSAECMTDEVSALQLLAKHPCDYSEASISDFYQKWQTEDLVIDKWFSAQVSVEDESVFDIINDLLTHPDFSIQNPNRVRSAIGAFVSTNAMMFHSATGKGYELLRKLIVRLNTINPQIGAGLCKQFSQWKKFDGKRQALIKEQLETILALDGLSKDIYEVAEKSLA